ncbi:MAG TPA: TetR family transcriptional regulator [Solirubrobacteraceae bacterium]|jgi:AcrR family transcriptional regulator|nr:TetR family transcriptional regulator [Solirubrobacteraceae bacterium]
MVIPVLGDIAEAPVENTNPSDLATSWAGLSATDKRARLLRAAGEVFARDGLDAPMPAIAAAAGAGVGSVYRQFPAKGDLLAALVVERLQLSRDGAETALASGEDAWSSLTGLLWALAERQGADEVMGEAMATVSEHPEVQEAYVSTIEALERLLDAARAEGSLRADATTLDLQLLFAATRAAGRFEDGAWRRMLALGIDALRA